MKIRLADPDDEKDIKAMSVLERSAFALSGNDPTECEEVLRFLAREKGILLGIEEMKGGDIPEDLAPIYPNQRGQAIEVPIAFAEYVTLDKGLEFYKENTHLIGISPFIVCKSQADRVYSFARRFASDDKILDCHGIGVHKDFQGSGRGRQILGVAEDIVSGKVAVGAIDLARVEENGLVDIFNDRSFALNTRSGFMLTHVLNPPVYESTITYAPVARVPGLKAEGEPVIVDIHALRQNPSELITQIGDLTQDGYVGTRYNIRDQKFTFRKLA